MRTTLTLKQFAQASKLSIVFMLLCFTKLLADTNHLKTFKNSTLANEIHFKLEATKFVTEIKSEIQTQAEAIPFGKTITLRKKNGDKNLISVVPGKNNELFANTSDLTNNNQLFRVEKHKNGGIALFSISANKYVQVFKNAAGGDFARATGNSDFAREEFEWKSKGTNLVAFKSLHSNKWLQGRWTEDNGAIRSSGIADKGWETFTWKIVDFDPAAPIATPTPNTPTAPATPVAQTQVVPFGKIITLRKSTGDKFYLSTVAQLNNDLYANQNAVNGTRQMFRVDRHKDGGVALFSISAKKYVRVNNIHTEQIINANGDLDLEWERFRWKSKGNGLVALKSLHTNKWLQPSTTKQGSPIFVNSNTDGPTETLIWKEVKDNFPTPTGANAIPFGKVITLRKTGGDLRFISTVTELGNDLYANKNFAGEKQMFRVDRHKNGGVALFSVSEKKYVQVFRRNQGDFTRATGNATNARERFLWKQKGNGLAAFKSVYTGKWLQAIWSENSAAVKSGGAIDTHEETFRWDVVATQQPKILTSSTAKSSVSVSPNPANRNDLLTINGKRDLKKVTIYDTSGKLSKHEVDSNNQIKINDLPTGLHFVEINNQKVKLIVN